MNRSSQFALSVKTIILSLILSAAIVSCSDDNDEPARSQDDIMGVWADIEGRYMHLAEDFKAYNLYVTDKDGKPSAEFEIPRAGYFYEPGYDILLYMSAGSQPEVYKIVKLTQDELEWCLVDNLLNDEYKDLSKSEIIGLIIKKAHEGYTINTDSCQTFTRVPESVYYDILSEFELDEEMVP